MYTTKNEYKELSHKVHKSNEFTCHIKKKQKIVLYNIKCNKNNIIPINKKEEYKINSLLRHLLNHNKNKDVNIISILINLKNQKHQFDV